MRIDISKVSLSEKDIEDWLFCNPKDLPYEDEWYDETPIVKWIGRQYHLPSGIADLIGLRDNGMLAVVEVKNVAINKAAILQVCRYASDLEQIVGERDNYKFKDKQNTPRVQKIVVGLSIDDQTFAEANSCNVKIICFSANLSIDLAEMSWTTEAYKNYGNAIEEISKQPEWDVFGIHHSDYFSRMSTEADICDEGESDPVLEIPTKECECEEQIEEVDYGS